MVIDVLKLNFERTFALLMYSLGGLTLQHSYFQEILFSKQTNLDLAKLLVLVKGREI